MEQRKRYQLKRKYPKKKSAVHNRFLNDAEAKQKQAEGYELTPLDEKRKR